MLACAHTYTDESVIEYKNDNNQLCPRNNTTEEQQQSLRFLQGKKDPPSVPGARLVEGLPRGFRKML